MSKVVTNLDQLRTEKARLQLELEGLNKTTSFENPVQSFRTLTNGASDKYIKEKLDSNGEPTLALRTQPVAKDLLGSSLMLGAGTALASLSKEALMNRSFLMKIFGLALVLATPIIVRQIQERFEANDNDFRY